jgi:hypothetical protein
MTIQRRKLYLFSVILKMDVSRVPYISRAKATPSPANRATHACRFVWHHITVERTTKGEEKPKCALACMYIKQGEK